MKDRVTVLPVAEVDVALTKYLEQNKWGQVWGRSHFLR